MCLTYALMTGMTLNYGAIFRLAMRKAKTHKAHRYAFGGLITQLCLMTGVPEEDADYFPIIQAPYIATNIKGLNVSLGPVLTTAERAYRDKFIAYMDLTYCDTRQAAATPYEQSCKMLRFDTF